MNPKVNFIVAGINETIDVFMDFLNFKEDSQKIFSKYSALKERFENSRNKKKAVRDFFFQFETKNRKIYEQVRDEFQKEWDKINDPIMNALEEVNEIKWEDEAFTARVTSNPICPRYLSENTFDVYFGLHNDLMIRIVIHELSHFIFFKKWDSIFPNYNHEEFESPHLLWKLSEMIPYVILGDKRIQEIYKHEPAVYDVWHKIEINGKPILKLLQEIYDNRRDFKDFVRKSWELVKNNRNILSS